MSDVKSIVAQLQKDGAELVKNVTVKNVTVTDKGSYTRVVLTLNKHITAKTDVGNGNFVDGTSNRVFTTTFSIGALLSEDEELAFAKNFIMKAPQMLQLLLSYAQVDIVVEPVEAKQEYHNPFSTTDNVSVVEHDTYYYHIVGITLGALGKKSIEKLQDKAMDALLASALSSSVLGSTEE